MQVEKLLDHAEESGAFDEWRAVILYYKAKHYLALNDFDTARKLLDSALDACYERNYGTVRGEIARE